MSPTSEPQTQDPARRLTHVVSMYRPVRVTCRAAHPDPRKPTQHCGTLLGYLPGPIRFVAVVQRMPEEGDGHLYACCPRVSCRTVNRFEVLEPSARGDGAGSQDERRGAAA